MKKILVLGAGRYHLRVYDSLRKGGFYTVGADANSEAPARFCADEFHAVDIADELAVVALAEKCKVNAVMPLNEFGMRSHAACVDRLGLLGNSLRSAEWVVAKEMMREKWKECDLPQPVFFAFSTESEAVSVAEKVGFPCVIKPVDSGGSGRGVFVLRSVADVEGGFRESLPFARNGRMLIESFIEGIEVTVEGLVQNGDYVTLAVSDKVKPDLRSRVAVSLNYPAQFDSKVLERIDAVTRDAVLCFGLLNSAVHAELIVTPEGLPVLVELGARGGGGHIFSDIVKIVSGVDMPCALAKILCGDGVDLGDVRMNGACYRFFNPPYGVLKMVRGLDVARRTDGVVDIGVDKKVGDIVGDLANSLERAGFIVTSGKDRAAAISCADHAEDIVEFVLA